VSAAQSLEPRDRFLRAIAERIAPERIAAIHLFPAVRSGVGESAVAVVAAVADEEFVQRELPPPVGADSAVAPDESAADAVEPPRGQAGSPPDIEDAPRDADSPHPSHSRSDDSAHAERPPRLVVYRALYRWTRKGPDRGKWEVDITAEADAPLHAVSDVVRGVQRRAGEDGEPELITPDALRVALSDRPWAAAM
jgi:hypothetical protein